MKRPRRSATRTAIAFALVIAGALAAATRVPVAATSGAVSVNFVGSGTAMAAAEIAGVVAKANWNNATGATRGTALALVDETGASSGATITWTSNNVWSTPITDQAGNRRFMKGYLDTTASSVTTVTVSGLSAGSYDIYVYADGDNGGATRTGAYRISGVGITATTINLTDAASTNFNTAFVQASNSAGNYVKFSINAGGFTLTATPGTSSDANNRAPLNGLQIVPGGGAPPTPDFTISASPGSRTLAPGSSASYTVSVGAVNGFTGSVALGVTGLPANATASFTPTTISGSGSATLNVSTAASTPAGSSTLTISGSSGSVSHTTSAALIVSAPSSAARAIGITFVGTGAAMGATETAGVVAKSNWNNATGAARSTPLALVDEAGAASSATATWTSNGLWASPITDQSGNRRLMKGYLDTSTTSVTTVSVTGLPSSGYDVYVYADGDNGAASRTAAYRISGTGITTTTINLTDAASTNFNTTFTQANGSAGNYVRFSINATAFTLTATPGTASDGTARAPLNGVQIVPAGGAPSPTYSISGAITPAAAGASATVNLGGAATASITANAMGAYTFTGLANGSYAVSPTKAGYTMSPSSRNVTINGAAVSGADFTATQVSTAVSISAPANGSTVASPFTISATTSGSVAGVQFRLDGSNAGAEDTVAPYSVSVTAPGGAHTLTAIARDTAGNTVTSATVNVTVTSASGTALTINGAQTFQTIDGFGVNLNSLSWKNGEAMPVLDMLIDQLGATQFRVVFDMEDWESANDNTAAATPNWTYYNALYSNAKFQNLWGTLHYLNQRGITSGINLSFMGRVPTWMGGATISASMEDEWVEMVATLLYYARVTQNVQFDMVDPLNEPDWDGYEGPQVDAAQYTRLLQKLSVKLDAMGLSALRFVGPNAAQTGYATSQYIPAMRANSTVMSKLDHFGFHNYAGSTGDAASAIQGSGKNLWMTESNKTADVWSLIGQNANSVQVWDAFDAVYNHAILAGRGSAPGNDDTDWPALIAYNSSTGVYTPRHEFYEMAQLFKFVPRGAVRIGATESNSSLSFYAFRDAVTGRLTIVGRNISSSAITVNGTLSSLPAGGVFQFYRTDVSGNNFARGADVVVTNGSFTFTAPVNSYFTLTTP